LEGHQLLRVDRLCLYAACAGAVLAAAAAEAGQYEQPPVLSASQLLPANLLSSPNYRIADRVPIENFQGVFKVDTKWGSFVIKGSALMRVRAREIAATAELEKIGGAETVVNQAGATALRPLSTAKDLVTEPGKTIGDTFKGVGAIWGQAKASMSATDPHKDSVLASLTGGATVRRKLAFNFAVDPNTSFPPLNDELTRVATASAVGETGANVGLAFVTGGAGIAISVGGSSQQLRTMLRDKTSAQLEADGRPALAAMGVSEATIDAFYATPNLTPTDKAVIVEAMKSLGTASGREIFVSGAAKAQSIEMGFFYRHQAVLIASFDKKVAPVHAFVRMGDAPMLQTDKGTVSILPVDYLYWSPPLEGLVSGARGGQIWITGQASALAKSQLASRGWTVVPKVGAQLSPQWP
jgi:hypothetical protein